MTCPRPCGARRPRGHRWCARAGRSRCACRAARACGRRTARPSRHRRRRCRRGRARRGRRSPWWCAGRAPYGSRCALLHCVGQGLAERCHLVGRADTDAQPTVGSGLTDQDAPREQTLPHGVPVVESPEEHKVRVALGNVKAVVTQPLHGRVTLGRAARRRWPAARRHAREPYALPTA